MTEEDTFNALKRPSLSQMNMLYKKWVRDHGDHRPFAVFSRDNHWDPDKLEGLLDL